MRVVLGNRNAVHQVRTGPDPTEDVELVVMDPGKRATVIELPEEASLSEAFVTITAADGVWANHVEHLTETRTRPKLVPDEDAEPDEEGLLPLVPSETETEEYEAEVVPPPAWVAVEGSGSDLHRTAFAGLLSAHFGGCEIRELEEPTGKVGKLGKGGKVAGARRASRGVHMPLPLLMPGLALHLVSLQLLLKTNAGNDFQAAQMGGSASATAVAKYMALTANATAPAAGDTTLTAEITTGGGGLIRAAGTYAHTTGAASYTMSKTFTANGSDSLPVTIAKVGVFDASSAGNLVFETLLGTTAVLSASGDALTITQTVSL